MTSIFSWMRDKTARQSRRERCLVCCSMASSLPIGKKDPPSVFPSHVAAVMFDRYEIVPGHVTSHHVCRFAIDRVTRQRVFIKFYTRCPGDIHRAAQLHARLKNSKAVCR